MGKTAEIMEEFDSPYMRVKEVARLARVSPKRIRNLMSSGVLRENKHFIRPRGLGPRFRRQAVLDWLQNRDLASIDSIPMARGDRRIMKQFNETGF